MTDKHVIYHKTPKGTEAIADRHSGLPPKLRSLLIMVDGKRSYADLAGLATVVGDCEQQLLQLQQEGLIEVIGGAPAASAVPTASAADMAPTAPAPLIAASLPEAKRFSSHLLEQILGPTSDVLCLKIEAANDLASFVSAIKRARDVVRDIKGAAAAERFIAQVELHTPQA
ncbi:hypothetical protein [Polaromonas sp. A23]|uniref:hypothetical protein n=1 Tax=Polaromonas sp. A23 TaxID=1944133 RepID=UPI000985AECD|nr:hypothetical protein [Polaromonas sp. A23]OOG37342.1 hypothetical protein B0B52_18280 [Polaromonas sp. A23]